MQQATSIPSGGTDARPADPSPLARGKTRCLLIFITLLPVLLIVNPLVLGWVLPEEKAIETLYLLWLDLLLLFIMWLCYRFVQADRPIYQRAALISLLALPFTLAASEALLLHGRADYQHTIGEEGRPNPPATSILKRDERFGWSLRPGASSANPAILVDRAGLRQTPPPAKGVTRTIHAFGDSFLFGQGVDQDKIATHLLAERFRGRARVLNYAVSGYGLEQMALRLEAADIKPGDLVIVTPISNDLRRNLIAKQLVCTHYEAGFADERFPRFEDGAWRFEQLRDHCPELGLPLARLAGALKEGLGVTERQLLAKADEVLHHAKAVAEDRGATFALVFQPNHKECRKGRFDLDLSALTVPFRDLTPACEAFDPAVQYTLTPSDYHWNENGHRWLADQLGDVIEALGLIEPGTS